MGSRDYLKLGDWNAICDRCGFKFKASELKPSWDNLMVCEECWEPRHPSDFYRGIQSNQSVPWTRPEQDDSSGTAVDGRTTGYVGPSTNVNDADKTLTVGTDPAIQIWNTALTADRTVTLERTGASARDRFEIYRTGGGAFTLIINDLATIHTVPANINEVVVVEYNGTSWQVMYITQLGL